MRWEWFSRLFLLCLLVSSGDSDDNFRGTNKHCSGVVGVELIPWIPCSRKGLYNIATLKKKLHPNCALAICSWLWFKFLCDFLKKLKLVCIARLPNPHICLFRTLKQVGSYVSNRHPHVSYRCPRPGPESSCYQISCPGLSSLIALFPRLRLIAS